MAFNGSGTYVLPAGNPVVSGTTISSTWANNTLSDMGSALTNCVTRDGQSPATANLPMGGFKLTGLAAATANGNAVRYEQIPFLGGTPLPVASGGTGAATLTLNNVLLGNGTSAPQAVAPGASGNLLTSNGTTWQSTTPAVPSIAGGATETSSAVDISLTGASTLVQAVTMTVDGKVVTLPNATTIATKGSLYVIKNTGLYTFTVRNSASSLIAIVGAGQIIGVYLTNNTTSAGTWAVGNQSTTSFLTSIFANAILTVNAVASPYTSVTTMSATQALVTYQGTSSYLQTCTLNISGTTVTAGAVYTVNAEASRDISVTTLSSTQALVTYRGLDGYLQTCTLNISGTTITAGAVLNVNAVFTNYTSVTTMSATQALVAYQNQSTGYLQSCVFTISGTTVTAGTILTANAVQTNYISVTTLSATQALVTYQGASNYLQTCTLNISGTTVTAGTVLNVNAVASTYTSVTTMSATQALVTYSGTSSYLQTCTLNISGTTVTAGTVLTVNAVASTYTSVTTLSATQALVTYRGTSSYLQAYTLNISGTTVTAGAVVNVNAVASTYTSVTTLSATQTLVTYSGTSDYLQTAIIEVLS